MLIACTRDDSLSHWSWAYVYSQFFFFFGMNREGQCIVMIFIYVSIAPIVFSSVSICANAKIINHKQFLYIHSLLTYVRKFCATFSWQHWKSSFGNICKWRPSLLKNIDWAYLTKKFLVSKFMNWFSEQVKNGRKLYI